MHKIKLSYWSLLLTVLILGITVMPVNASEVIEQTVYWGTAARGMGGAYTAAGGDIGGITYNPANSATISNAQLATDFNRLSQESVDVNNSAFAGAVRSGEFVHGVALHRTDLSFNFGNWQYTSGLELDYTDDIFYYNLGWNFSPDIHLGTNIKYFSVNTSVDDGNASGYGLDLGYMQFIGDQISVGAAIKNIISDKDWDSGTSEDVPMEARAGVRFRPDPDMALEVDVVYGEDPGFRSINLGGEWWVWKEYKERAVPFRAPYFRQLQHRAGDGIQYGVALRAGMEMETAGAKDNNLSFGIGMRFGSGHLDYSFQQRSDFDNQHFFGFSALFGAPEQTNAEWSDEDFGAPQPDQAQQLPGQQVSEPDYEQLPDFTVSKNIGLLQWEKDDGLDFEPEMLSAALADRAEHELTVYESNNGLQQVIMTDSLPTGHRQALFERTGREVFVTGSLGADTAGYTAVAVILTADQRHEISLEAASLETLIDGISQQTQDYLEGL